MSSIKTNEKSGKVMDKKVILSTLWVFALLNYIYADVYTLTFNPILQKELWVQFLSGYVGSIPITQSFVLITAILMETAIVMVLLSRVLKYNFNRWANIVAGIIHTLFVFWSLIGDTPTLFYLFFASIEILCTMFIVLYAWKWKNPESSQVIQ